MEFFGANRNFLEQTGIFWRNRIQNGNIANYCCPVNIDLIPIIKHKEAL